MDYKLAKSLKDEGFPQNEHFEMNTCNITDFTDERVAVPTLSELIDECGTGFKLFSHTKGYVALREAEKIERFYETPEEAMGRFWLKKNKKS